MDVQPRLAPAGQKRQLAEEGTPNPAKLAKLPATGVEVRAPQQLDPLQSTNGWLAMLPKDIIFSIAQHLEASGSIYAFMLCCTRFNFIASRARKTRLRKSHVVACFQLSLKKLFAWFISTLSAPASPCGAALTAAAGRDNFEMIAPEVSKMEIGVFSLVAGAACRFHSIKTIETLWNLSHEDWQKRTIVDVATNVPTREVLSAIMKFEGGKHMMDDLNLLIPFEKAGYSNIIEWIHEEIPIDTEIAASFAIKRGDEKHFFWALSKGAQVTSRMYVVWGLHGRLDIIRKLDAIGPLDSRQFDPEEFVHPIVNHFLRMSWNAGAWGYHPPTVRAMLEPYHTKHIDEARTETNKRIKEVADMYGADSLPEWARLRLNDSLVGAQEHHF